MSKDYKKMLVDGLTSKDVEASRESNGSNALTQVEQDPIWKKVLEGFTDPMIIILLVALAIQVVFVIMGKAEWFEAAGILIAVLIANLVGVLSENSQESKAAALRAEEQAKEKAKVIRDGKLIEISVNDIVVGDIVQLQAGDKIPADGIIIDGNIKVDQASLNGESEEAKKNAIALDKVDSYLEENEIGKDLMDEYYLYRGTVVCNGTGAMLITVVGDKTTYGKLALEMQEETRETPLQVKLGKLAKQISVFGYIGASIIFCVFMLQNTMFADSLPANLTDWVMLCVDAISLAVVIVCMAVPEGLPMMISMVLSMNMGKMMKDNVLVHKLNGIETAGGLNILFSDKTGTITKGQLSVVEVANGEMDKFTDISDMPNHMKHDFVIGIGANNSAKISDKEVIGGNSTDRALMKFILDTNSGEIDKAEVREFNAFDSTKKCSSIIVKGSEKTTVYVKGAAERIIERCTSYVDSKGKSVKITDAQRERFNSYMNEQASRSMRLLAVATVEGDDVESNKMTLVGIISIRDDVRPEAITAIEEVKRAGVQVVMVTGDRYETAVAIAKEAGLYTDPDNEVALTSAQLNEMSDEKVKEILPKLRVVARALPTDKSRLVNLAQELDLVAGMTGDGVNDAPALKKADVGFAMGSGTEVAKEAGDITILDDNFLSIEKAILYGRTIFTNIRKFLIFQLCVNVTTVALCFLAPLMGIAQPFSIVSILAINLVMDTLAAIAFGCEPALARYMNDKPIKRAESMLTKYMLSQIGLVSVFCTVVGLFILKHPYIQAMYNGGNPVTEIYAESALMAFFMIAIIFNGFNARSTNVNLFEHIGENKPFSFVMLCVFALVIALIHVVAGVAGLCGITLRTWVVMGTFAFFVIPLDMIRKVIYEHIVSK